jgi:uncharacterized protein (TIGR03435 family)
MIGEITNHLWQSTVFASAAALLALAFRKNRAEVRYWLWLSASLKFLVPFSLLISVGIRVWEALQGGEIPTPIAASAVSQTAVEVIQPFSENLGYVSSTHHTTSWIPAAVLTLWTFGFFCVALMRIRTLYRIRAAVRASSSINVNAAMPVRCSKALLEPGVVGFLRPVLLLPEGILKKLTPPQLEAVLAHEQCHVRRRDNLTSAFHMLVEAIFWFHPVVWWIGAKLVEERERACDEAVLRLGNEPQVYAEGILNVCKSYLESPLRCVSGVTGSDLKKRIRAILDERVAGDLNFAKKVALATAGIIALAIPICVGAFGAPTIRAQSAAAARPQFEVASVKPDTVAGPPGFLPIRSGDLVLMHNNQLQGIVMYAYHVAFYQLVGFREIPDAWKWYDIDARVAGTPSDDELRLMFQSLLEDRFKLKVHRETREMDVYKLVVAKNGPKLRPTSPDDYKTAIDDRPLVMKPGRIVIIRGDTGSHLIGKGVTIVQVASQLSGVLRGPVVDATGLAGTFDFDVVFAPEDAPPSAEFSAPTLSAALKTDLGLNIEKSKGPVEVLVLDRLEKLSPN